MKVKIEGSRQDIYNMGLAMVNLEQGSTNPKFTYAVNKNVEVVRKALKGMPENTKTQTDKFLEFTKEQQTLVQTFAAKNEEGKFIITDNQYTFKSPEREKEWSEKFEELKAKYSATIDAQKAYDGKVQAFMQDKVTVEFMMIDEDNLPTEIKGMEPGYMRAALFTLTPVIGEVKKSNLRVIR